MLRLAILDADILYDELRPKWHSYGQMFVHLLRDAGIDWQLDVHSVINGQYPAFPDDYDAFLITGSKYDSFADDQWIVQLRNYARELYAAGKPITGICFGHQVLAHALGGEAARSDAGWGLGVMSYELQDPPAFIQDHGPVRLIISHRDQVSRLPEQAQLLLHNDFCPMAAFHIPGRVLAIQGHPEFTVDYARDLLDQRVDALPADLIARARETLQTPHDGAKVAHWIRDFTEQASGSTSTR